MLTISETKRAALKDVKYLLSMSYPNTVVAHGVHLVYWSLRLIIHVGCVPITGMLMLLQSLIHILCLG